MQQTMRGKSADTLGVEIRGDVVSLIPAGLAKPKKYRVFVEKHQEKQNAKA